MKKFLVSCLLVCMVVCSLAAGAGAADESLSSVYAEFVSKDGDILTFDVFVDDKAGLGVTSVGLELDYSDNVTLISCEKAFQNGVAVMSPEIDVKPYVMVWVWATDVLPAGKTAVFRLEFELSGELGEDDTVDLWLEYTEDGCPTGIDNTVFEDSFVLEKHLFLSASDMVSCNPEAGDVNGDGKRNLSDVSSMLKHIARWTIDIDVDMADVVNDDKVNLTDVSAMLKHIAKWTTVRPGHNDSILVLEEATCRKSGESTLTYKECSATETVVTPIVPCKYTKKTVTEPTCGKDGTDRYTCTMCGDTYERKTPATGDHSYKKSVVTEATCTKKGQAKYTCSVCGDSYTKSIKATGKHTYSGGKCTSCGKADPNYTTPVQSYCNWLVKNGYYSDSGSYYDYVMLDEFYIDVDYSPSDEALVISILAINVESYEMGMYAFVSIPTTGTATQFEFGYVASSDYTTYLTGGETMSAREFCNKSTIDFDWYVSDVYDYCPTDHKELAWSAINVALLYASDMIAESGTGFTLSSLGFAGY